MHELTLRPIEVSDATRVHGWASRGDACRYQTWGPNTREETDAFVAAAVRTWDDPCGPRVVWAADLVDQGLVGLGETNRRTSTCVEIAYSVHVELWGRGLGTQVARLLLGVAFAQPGVERIQATCDPRNLASAAILRRVGFSFEGILRHTALLRDGWRDSAMHSILRSEWTSSGPR